MAQDAQTILSEILAHMAKEGGPPSTWYAGITSDIDSRLFGDQCVPRKDHWCIWRTAHTAEDARQIEKVLIGMHGCDGGPDGGDDTSTIVYCNIKGSYTNP